MLDLANKKVLVTGANGFVGLNLIRLLKEKGAILGAVVGDETNKDQLTSLGVAVFLSDIRDSKSIADAVDEFNPLYVYHLAAIGSVPYSLEHPKETMEVNLLGTLNLLEAIKDKNLQKFIYISSAEVYDMTASPVKEGSPIKISSPYGASKVAADSLVASYYNKYNLPVVILRPCNIFGPGNTKNVIYSFCNSALLGEDLNIEGGDQIKTFLYIEDAINALFLVSQPDKFLGEVFNLGSKNKITILDLAKKIIELSSSNSKINLKEKRGSGATSLYCDVTKIEQVLNWSEKTSLDEGLKNVINWLHATK